MCSTYFRNAVGKYTAVNNEFIDDKNLYNKERGLLLLILRNAEEWRVYPEELAKRCKDSVSAVKNQIKALEKAGYIRTYRKFNGYGAGSETHRFCADKKITDEVFEQLIQDID